MNTQPTQSAIFQDYKGEYIPERKAVLIRGIYFYIEKNEGDKKQLSREYSVFAVGWGSSSFDWNIFTKDERQALLSTVK